MSEPRGQSRVSVGEMIQHMDGRQGRVVETGLRLGALPAAKITWFRGATEVVLLGYIWATRMEENWE